MVSANLTRIVHQEYWGHISKTAKNFIDSLLQVDPKKRFVYFLCSVHCGDEAHRNTHRLTAKGALEHPWLKNEQSSAPLSVGTKVNHTDMNVLLAYLLFVNNSLLTAQGNYCQAQRNRQSQHHAGLGV